MTGAGRRLGRRRAGWPRLYGGVRWPDHRCAGAAPHRPHPGRRAGPRRRSASPSASRSPRCWPSDLSGSEKLAGLAQTIQVLGAAVASFLLARLMGAARPAARAGPGYLLGAAGAALAVVAGVVGSMPLLLVGAAAAGRDHRRQQRSPLRRHRPGPARATRARALSMVVWATTIGAVAGPNLTGPPGAVAPTLGHPRADRAVRVRQRRHARGRAAWSASSCGPTRCWSPARRRWRRAGRRARGTIWGRASQAVRERPVCARRRRAGAAPTR